MVIGAWARAAQTVFGKSVIVTPDSVLDADEALALATTTSKGLSDRPRWRRLVPETAVTLLKDERLWRRAREVTVAHELSVLDGCDVPFVWQHHTLFEPRGALVADALRFRW